MSFYAYSNPCVVCGARPFQRCVVPRTGRKTDTRMARVPHMARVRGEWPEPPSSDATSPTCTPDNSAGNGEQVAE